jgi:ABC-2 type transport system permease protein
MSAYEIMRREWTRMPPVVSGGKGALVPNLLALAFVAVLLPFSMGKTFLEPCSLILFAALSVLIVCSLITGCFFGPEARLDLRELAAGGASGGAIALGKAGAAAMRGWLLGMAVLLGGLVTVNLAYWPGHVLAPPNAVSGQAIALSLAGSWLVAMAGALISLRASSVRQAQDSLKVAILMAILAAIDLVWFFPGDLLEIPYIAWIAAGVLVAAAAVLFQPLRKQLGARTTADTPGIEPAIRSYR